MRKIKALGWVSIFLFTVYVLYVASVAVFLNTPLFAEVAGMEDPRQTYVRFQGAFSLFPGHLYSPSARVFIGDQNVSIGIDVSGVHARFRLKPLLEKRFEISSLVIDQTVVDVGLKTVQESEAYVRQYTQADSLDLEKRIQLSEERSKSRLTLDFQSITIKRITKVHGAFGELDGEMDLQGGFLIQPKVQVEVYPTTLRFLSGIVGRADVRIDRFRTVDAPGNAVFPYVSSHFNFKINTQSLRRINFRLEALPGYSLDEVGSNGEVDIRIVKGVLQKGSFIQNVASRLVMRTPALDAAGVGHLRWEVDAADSSRLRATANSLHLVEKKSARTNKGSIRSAELDARIYGNRLVAAFNGVALVFKLKGLDWHLKSDFERNPNFFYEGHLTGDGVLSGFTGDVPQKAKKSVATGTRLDLKIPQLSMKTSFASHITGTGTVRLSGRPVDLAGASSAYPDVSADLNLKLGDRGEVKSKAVFTRLEHQLTPIDTWKAKLHWTLDRTDPIVEAIAAQSNLSGTVQSLAKVRDLQMDVDCELSDETSLIRLSEIKSSGSWKGYGTLRNDAEGVNGLFEMSVLTVPVGVWVRPQATEIQFMPNREWYDRTQDATTVTSAQLPKATGAPGKR